MLIHPEWLGLLLEHEVTQRQQKRFEARARTARLRHNASVEDVDYHAARGLDRTMLLKLASGDFIRERRNLLITGPCGVGKSWLACALRHQACREDFSVLYHRMPRLFAALALARGDGRYAKLLRMLARVDLLVLDDWGPELLNAEQRRDLRDCRGSLRCPFNRHQPATSRALVRDHRQPDSCRRHPRSHHPQCLQNRSHR